MSKKVLKIEDPADVFTGAKDQSADTYIVQGTDLSDSAINAADNESSGTPSEDTNREDRVQQIDPDLADLRVTDDTDDAGSVQTAPGRAKEKIISLADGIKEKAVSLTGGFKEKISSLAGGLKGKTSGFSSKNSLYASGKKFPIKYRIGFLILSFILLEFFVRITDTHAPFFGMGLIRSLFAAAAFGTFVFLIGYIITRKGISRGITIFTLFGMALLCMIHIGSRIKFGTYFQVSYMFKMAGNAVGGFMGDIVGLAIGNLWLIPLMLAPGILFIIFRKKLIPEEFKRKTRRNKKKKQAHILRTACLFLGLFLISLILCWIGGDRPYYTYDFTATNAIPRFGVLNTFRLECEYGIFGTPKRKIVLQTESEEDTAEEESSDGSGAEKVSNIVYKDNVMDIDFDALIESDTSEIYELMDTYFSSQKPTKQNEYTGMFTGKNLIFISAEAFSTICIDRVRTPALWRLSQTGFVFDNYYQPDFDQSTTGGEFANMTGVIPIWIDGMPTYLASEYNYMPFALGTLFGNMGYNVTAWHNGDYDYYYRPELYPNMGYYDYYAIGGGLDIEDIWPASDLEMMQASIGGQIDEYVNNGTPFHAYYMTISGHGGYDFNSNNMAIKNREVTEGVSGYEKIDAYLAASMELEYAMEYLLDELEKAGILDDTVIVMGADHYPYYLTEDQDEDYFAIAAGLDEDTSETERHHNTLILWSGCIEDETKHITTPCFSCDIIPTILNLFGIEYDSRLLSGSDIFAPDVEAGEVASNMHVVCFANGCWVTAAGKCDAINARFYPAEGVTLENKDEYIEEMNDLVAMRCTFARYIVEFDYYAHVFQ